MIDAKLQLNCKKLIKMRIIIIKIHLLLLKESENCKNHTPKAG